MYKHFTLKMECYVFDCVAILVTIRPHRGDLDRLKDLQLGIG